MAVGSELIHAAPTLLSLARVPLGVAFFTIADEPVAALSVIAASGATDMLDGWAARRTGNVTQFGAIVDPLTDKWFMACVIGALVAHGKLPPAGVLALVTREVAELPLAIHELRKRAEGEPHIEHPMAVRAGKIATALQFASITAAVLDVRPLRDVLLSATAIAGVVAGLAYWRRSLSVERTT
jgi:phosphatidylglycerophosphate synthase